MKKILIIGATSAIAQATAKLYCEHKVEFYLVGRYEKKLQIIGEDLLTRGANKVTCLPADPALFRDSDNIIASAKKTLERIDIALVAHGDIPDQEACENSNARTARSFQLNSLSIISILTSLAVEFEQQRSGCLLLLSSMSGDLCHKGNYINAAEKASVNRFMQGLSDRFRFVSVDIITIKPAFVDTPLTEGYKKNFLWVKPERIAKGIKKAVERDRSAVIYLPWYWRWNGVLARLLPEKLVKNLPI